MRIVIIGDGKVGYKLAEQLSKEGHDIVLIDKNDKLLKKSVEKLDIMGIEGNGASIKVQLEAGIEYSDILIAATSEDETNLLCCIIAKKSGCKYTIARVRNLEYDEQIDFLRKDLGLSMTINPEKTAAIEMFRLLQFPTFLKLDSFMNGSLELVELKVRQNSIFNNMKLSNIYNLVKSSVLVCTIERDGKVIVPNGEFILREGDKFIIAAQTNDLSKILKNFKINSVSIDNVIIVGGSRIAIYLAELLIEKGVNVKIIEKDYSKCKEMASILSGASIIHADGSVKDVLVEEGINDTDALVTLTNIDEENIIISMYANYLGVPKTITKVNRIEFGSVFFEKGIDSIVSPKMLAANEIIRYVRGINNRNSASIINLHRIANEQVEALEFIIDDTVENLNIPIESLKIKSEILLVSISRNGKLIIPKGNDVLKAGDSVVIVTSPERKIKEFNEIFI